jgi:cytoskeletal protein CcmA (bactofilin family)
MIPKTRNQQNIVLRTTSPSPDSLAEGQIVFAMTSNKGLNMYTKRKGQLWETSFYRKSHKRVIDDLEVRGKTEFLKDVTIRGTSFLNGIVDITNTTDSSDDSGDTGALRVEGGVSIAKKLYVGTNLDVDGTTNLDAVDIDGNVQLDGTLTVGTDGSGQDVTFYSGTSGDSFVWDASEEKLTITGTDGQTALDIADGNLVVADNIDVEGNLDVNGTTNLDDVDIDGNVDINGTISASAIYQHTGNTATNITFGTNTIGFFQAHANAGGEASLRVNSEGVIVNPIGEAGIDFRVESNTITSALKVDAGDDILSSACVKVSLPNLPTSDPGVAGQLWNNSGTVKVST